MSMYDVQYGTFMVGRPRILASFRAIPACVFARLSVSVVDPDPLWFWSAGTADPDPSEQSSLMEKREETHCFEVLDVLFWGLEVSPVTWTRRLSWSPGKNTLQFLIQILIDLKCWIQIRIEPMRIQNTAFRT